MKRLLYKLMSAGLLSLSFTSCIDKNYDLSKGVDLKVAVGGDSISLPFINSLKIYLKDLIDTDSIDLLKADANGYSISQKSDIDIDVPKVDIPVIEDKVITPDPIHFSFKDGSTAEITIPGIDKSSSFPLNIGKIGDFDIPSVSHSSVVSIVDKLGKFDLKSKTVSIPQVSVNKNNLFKDKGLDIPASIKSIISSLPGTYTMTLAELGMTDPDIAISESEVLSFDMEVPDQIEAFGKVTFNEDAELTLSVSMVNFSDILKEGNVVPSLDIITPSFFIYDPVSDKNTIKLNAADAMTPSNGYTLVKKVKLKGVDLSSCKAENGKIVLKDSLCLSGTLTMQNASCYIKKFGDLDKVALKVEAAFNGITIQSMTFTVPTQETEISSTADLSFSFELPEEIASIQSISLQGDSKVNIHLGGKGLAQELLDHTQIALRIALPDIFVMTPDAHYDGNTYILPGQSIPSEGIDIQLGIQSINLAGVPISADRKVELSRQIAISGKVSVGGEMSSTAIPTDENACFGLSAQSGNLKMDNAFLTVNPVMKAIEPYTARIDIEEKLDTMIKRINSANVKEGTGIDLTFDVPQLPQPSDCNISVCFPQMLRFKAVQGLDTASNIYTIQGELPEAIHLQLQRLDINQDLRDGILSYHDSIVISGQAGMQGGSVTYNDFKNLDGKSVGYSARMKDIKIDDISVDLNAIHAGIKDTADIDVEIEMPEEIKAIDSIYLSGTHLSISMKLENVPALNNMRLKAKINFPAIFVIDDPAVDADNCWTFTKPISAGTSSIQESLSIKALQLKGKTITKDFKLTEQIPYSMDIDIAESSISSKDINDITVTPVITLGNIVLQKLVGTVDVDIDKTDETFSLGSELSDIKGNGTYLDLSPVVRLDFSTNLGIPMALDASITAIDASKQGDKTSFQLVTKKAATPSETAQSRFWIAEDSEGMPSDYEFVEARNINSIISGLPDQLNFIITGNTDKSQTHFYDMAATYFAKASYDISIPLVFGENAKIVYQTEVEASLDEAAEYITDGIEIYGTMSNSIPLNITVTLTPTDKDKKDLGLEPVRLNVAAGHSDGSPTVSEVSARLMDKDGKLKEMCGFRISAVITSDKMLSNTQIKPENGLEIMLKLRIPGGLQADLND